MGIIKYSAKLNNRFLNAPSLEYVQIRSFEIIFDNDRLSLRQNKRSNLTVSVVGTILLAAASAQCISHNPPRSFFDIGHILLAFFVMSFPLLGCYGIYYAWTDPKRYYVFDKADGTFRLGGRRRYDLASIESLEVSTTLGEDSRTVALQLRTHNSKRDRLLVYYSSITDDREVEERVSTASAVAEVLAHFLDVPIQISDRSKYPA